MFSQIGPLELIVVLVVVLLIFGPKRLPGLGRQLGKGMREFKQSITGESKDDDEDDEVEREHVTLAAQSDATASKPDPAASKPDPAAKPEPDVVSDSRG